MACNVSMGKNEREGSGPSSKIDACFAVLCRLDRTYRDDVRVDDIDQTADDDDEITTIRWITEIILERETSRRDGVDRSASIGGRRVTTLTWNAAIFRTNSMAKIAVKTMFK